MCMHTNTDCPWIIVDKDYRILHQFLKPLNKKFWCGDILTGTICDPLSKNQPFL